MDLRRLGDLHDLDAADADAPLVRDRLHLLLHVGVDPFTFGQGLIEAHRADDRAQRRPGQSIDADVEVRHTEQRRLGVDDLREDRCIHGDDHVVLGDHFLPITGTRDLSHVDSLQSLDERRDQHETRLVRASVLTEPLDHTDLTLLHDVDGLTQRGQQHDDDQGQDCEPDQRPHTHD